MDLVAERHGLRLVSDDELYAEPPEDVDVVISFLFWKLIREPLVTLGRIGCLNFHPAPLPDLRGLGGYNVAILEGMREWGVSCHFVDESFDTGDLVEVERFPIDPDSATAFSLDLESQERLLGLFQRVMGMAMAGEELPRTPQGPGATWMPTSSSGSAACARATTSIASCARSGIRPIPARSWRWTAATSRSWTSGCWRRSPRPTATPGWCRRLNPMNCAACGTENPAGARFCMACG